MKQLLRLFGLLQKRWLKSASLCVLLIAFPLFMLLLQAISIGSERNDMTVLLYCDRPDTLTETAFADLTQKDSQARFILASDAEELKAAIIRGEAECGYVFPDNLEERILSGKTDSSIVLYRSSSSAMYLLTRELVYGAILHQTSETMAEQFFRNNHRYKDQLDALLVTLPEIYDTLHTQEDVPVTLTIRTLSGGNMTMEKATEAYTIPVRGLGSILLFVMALLGAAMYLQDREHGLYHPMPRTLRLASASLSILTLLLPCALSVLTAVFLCGEADTSPVGLVQEFAAMLAYLFLLDTFASLLARILRKSEWLFALLPLLSIAALILCPVFVNLGSILYVLSWLEKCFPPYYYLASFNNRPLFLLITVLLGALLTVADRILNIRQNG